MTCELCEKSSPVYNFNSRCCVTRWLRGALPAHAKAWLDRYQKQHGRPAMLDLIAAAKTASSTDAAEG